METHGNSIGYKQQQKQFSRDDDPINALFINVHCEWR